MLDTERHVFPYCPLQRMLLGCMCQLRKLAGSVQLSGSQDCVEEDENPSTASVRNMGRFLGISLPYGESCTPLSKGKLGEEHYRKPAKMKL